MLPFLPGPPMPKYMKLLLYTSEDCLASMYNVGSKPLNPGPQGGDST